MDDEYTQNGEHRESAWESRECRKKGSESWGSKECQFSLSNGITWQEREKIQAEMEREQYLTRILNFIAYERKLVALQEIQEKFPLWKTDFLLEELVKRGVIREMEPGVYVPTNPIPTAEDNRNANEQRKIRIAEYFKKKRKDEILAFIKERHSISKEGIINQFPYIHSANTYPELDAEGILGMLEAEELIKSESRLVNEVEVIVYSPK